MDVYTFIIVINWLSAISTIIFTFLKPKLTFVPILNLVLSIITAVTTEYNSWTISLIILSLILLLIFYSVKKYSEVEFHCSQASALFGGKPTTKELIKTVTNYRKPQVIKPLIFAKGIETVARNGVQYSVMNDLLNAAGNLHIGLSHDFLKCITLLINTKRFFGLSESYKSIADKLAYAAQQGVQLEQFEVAFKAYKEKVIINKSSLVEFLSALITIIKAGTSPQKAGESLAIIMNSLL